MASRASSIRSSDRPLMAVISSPGLRPLHWAMLPGRTKITLGYRPPWAFRAGITPSRRTSSRRQPGVEFRGDAMATPTAPRGRRRTARRRPRGPATAHAALAVQGGELVGDLVVIGVQPGVEVDRRDLPPEEHGVVAAVAAAEPRLDRHAGGLRDVADRDRLFLDTRNEMP